jgi:hypothetical protein
MTSSVTQATATFIRSTAHTPTVGVIAVVLLLVLLMERELLRAHGGRRARIGMAALAIPIAPLVLACAVTVTLRVTPILSPTPAAHAPAHVRPNRAPTHHVRPAPEARGTMGDARQRPGGRRPIGRSARA